MRASKRTLHLFGLLVIGATLSGCVTTNESLTGVSNPGKRAYLDHAAENGPVLVRVAKAPFKDPDSVAAAVARHGTGAVFGSTAAFTADHKSAEHPNFRVVVLFQPAVNATPGDVCANPATAPTAPDKASELSFLAAFCARDEPISGVHVSGPRPVDVNNPAFAKMVRAAFSDLFPHNNPDHDGKSGAVVLSSLQVFPSLRFVRDPLAGLF